MGVVYEAEDLVLRRRVALKVLAPQLVEDTDARRRFQREIDLAVAIEHPNVVPVYAAGFERPHFYIAMRLVRGPDLATIIRDQGPLPEDRALRLLGQIASALHACHERNMVHRDVKPANVLVWGAGEEDEHAMLTDFGIARALDDSASLTGFAAIGTPAYMAPEVILGNGARPASDQYSLAVLAYEMLSGELPFDGGAAELRDAHVSAEPRALRDSSPDVSETTADVIARALAKRPEDRFSGVKEMVRAARGADRAFERSERISQIVRTQEKPETVVRELHGSLGLTDDAISQITDIDRTQIVRLRRRAARRALLGER
jgi:serine/threonine-protein kinase